jgi:hypothetical protein
VEVNFIATTAVLQKHTSQGSASSGKSTTSTFFAFCYYNLLTSYFLACFSNYFTSILLKKIAKRFLQDYHKFLDICHATIKYNPLW